MPATQRIYKVDVNELASDLALLNVTGKTEEADVIINFCGMYSIPIDSVKLGDLTQQYTEIAKAIKMVEDSAEKKKK